MTVNIPAVSLAAAKPRLLWIGQVPQASGLDLRRLLRNVEIVFEPRIGRGLQRLRVETFAAAIVGVVTSLSIHIGDAETKVEEILNIADKLPILIWSPEASVDEAIAYTRRGAAHVFVGNFDSHRLQGAVNAALQSRLPETIDDFETAPWRGSLIGNSPAILELCELIQLIASRRVTVMISGETGTGKEVVARAIHSASKRSALPIIAVNCTALPSNLVESELFGHAKGAFTGAHAGRIGRFEQAHRGSIFLDEIGDLPLEAQGKLLRVLQEQEFERVGSSETVRVDVRVIAASNVDLQTAVRERRFREDLFYRLNVVPVHLPPLRDRREDIPLLIDHFLEKMSSAETGSPKQVSGDAVDFLTSQNWPGNVRQLEHALEKAFVLSGNRNILYASDFAVRSNSSPAKSARFATPAPDIQVTENGIDFDEVVERFELSLVNQALALTSGNKARAADLLSIKRTTLLAKLKVFEDRKRESGSSIFNPDAPKAEPATVLVLENEGPLRKLVSNTLGAHGYRVLETADPKTALELFQCWKEHIKLLIVDSDVPGCAPADIIGRFQSISPGLGALVLSNSARHNSIDNGDPRCEIIAGPFSSEALIQSLGRLLKAGAAELAACTA